MVLLMTVGRIHLSKEETTYNKQQKLLQKIIRKLLDSLSSVRYDIREKWLKVTFALKNHSDDTKDLVLYFTQNLNIIKMLYFESAWNSIKDCSSNPLTLNSDALEYFKIHKK